MEPESKATTPVNRFTSGVRSNKGTGPVKRFATAKEAYNDSYNDIWSKFNGKSSWVTPDISLASYISKYAPKEDNNDPASYSSHMVNYLNKQLGKTLITKDSTLSSIKDALSAAGLNPEHTITKAHLAMEDPKVLKELNI